MRRRHGLTLIEALALLVLLGAAIAVLVYTMQEARRAREESRRIRCRGNLHQFFKGMATYLNEYGDGRFYSFPLGRGLKAGDFNGAEWLASLYWTRIIPDPGCFNCPSTRDTNHQGQDMGFSCAIPGRFGSQTVSYAGFHYRSVTDADGNPMAIKDEFPPDEPMASDDTEGTVNHGTATNGGMCVLFFDSHVEFWTQDKIDLTRGVGRKGGPLWRLRN